MLLSFAPITNQACGTFRALECMLMSDHMYLTEKPVSYLMAIMLKKAITKTIKHFKYLWSDFEDDNNYYNDYDNDRYDRNGYVDI